MSYFLDRFLKNGRKHLNRIIMGIDFMKITGRVGAAGALAIFTARIFGWTGDGALHIWFIITGIGGVAGLFTGWRRRLDIQGTARWLDAYQKNDEALSAALLCQARNCSEPLDEMVVDRAEAIVMNPEPIRWPTGYLIRRIAIAGGLLLGALATVLWNPVPALNLSRYIITEKTVNRDPVNPKQDIDRLREPEMAKELAKQFFPKDVKRAGEFQQALESGDINQLEELLRYARQTIDTRMAQNPSQTEQDYRLDEERQLVSKMESLLEKIRQRERNRLIEGQSNPTGQDESGRLANRNNKVEHRQKPDATKGSKKRLTSSSQDQNRSFFRFLWKNTNPGGKLENTKNGELYKGGTDPGQEPGNKQGKWPITPRSGSDKVAGIKQEIPEVEYVLPGKNATVPLSRVLPDFQRAAESALSRNGVPSEYDDFVRNYFLELSREIKGSSPESEGKL